MWDGVDHKYRQERHKTGRIQHYIEESERINKENSSYLWHREHSPQIMWEQFSGSLVADFQKDLCDVEGVDVEGFKVLQSSRTWSCASVLRRGASAGLCEDEEVERTKQRDKRKRRRQRLRDGREAEGKLG